MKEKKDYYVVLLTGLLLISWILMALTINNYEKAIEIQDQSIEEVVVSNKQLEDEKDSLKSRFEGLQEEYHELYISSK